MKAINERLQEGLDHFMKNKSWRSIYEDAPVGAKEELELKFYNSYKVGKGEVLSTEEYLEIGRGFKNKKKKADYKYLLMFAKDPRHKAALQRAMDACEE